MALDGEYGGVSGWSRYASKCGNPNATCATGTPNCTNGVSAYFYPMFDPPENTYQPNAVCVKGSLSIRYVRQVYWCGITQEQNKNRDCLESIAWAEIVRMSLINI
jgi:hypothetical protein